VQERVALAKSMQAFEILIGQGHRLDTVAGFTSWRLMTTSYIIGAIWAIRTSCGLLRGEEDAGRWELLLAGPTTPRRATIQVLVGLAVALLLMWAVIALFTLIGGRMPAAHFGVGGSLLESIALISGAAMFLAIGALASQVSATAGQATMLSSIVIGVAYVVRLIADANNSLDWLRWVSPIGWIEELRPLEEPQLVALVPMGVLIVACCVVSVFLAGRRDLNASVLRERTGSGGNPRWLRGPVSLTMRLTRTSSLAWILGTGAWLGIVGSLTHSATGIITASSPAVAATLSRLGLHQATAGFLGLVFLFAAIGISLLAATQMVSMRDEESSGRLDNILVRRVPRMAWLMGRVGVAIAMVVIAGVVSGLFTWIGSANQHTGVGPLKLLEAGLNVVPPGVFIIGAGTLVFGLRPQLTGAAVYGIVAWSFLIDLLSALIKNADWLRDSSLLTHVQLAPGVNPDWGSNAIMVLLGLGLAGLGALAFQRRDIAYD
ncbi:MAG: ABC transporter permease subunit, partial [Chloroflexi bacterium]|nr:ABC transporter permease subunit [Chloroflexota bacterium]